MEVISQIEALEFKANSTKEAFLKANKWIAKNIINNNLDLVWSINKLEDGTVILTLYTKVDINKVFDNKCKACRSFHTKFYINHQFNCDKCNAQALIETLKDKSQKSKEYYKNKLNT